MNLAKIEEEVLEFWEKEDIFQKTIENRKNSPFFSFYDGPPFATGNPHYGHVLASTIKDAVLRYKTMCGFQVPRRVGWDCHGLPVENLIEKEKGIKSKQEIEEMGIEKFNEACQGTVFRCVDEWKKTLKRVGRWADYKDDYATMGNDYIESVWWVLKSLWDQQLVYRDYRVTPYCYRCETPVSNFEVNQGYEETENPSIFVNFRIKKGDLKGVSLLAWTTTPWTLIGNVALVVDPEKNYAIMEDEGEKFIVIEERPLEGAKKIGNIKGKELVGLEYEPLFNWLAEEKPEGIENAFRVYGADFVNTEEGTGIVHTAVMYGEDDFNLGKKYGLPFFHTVNEMGKFSLGKWKGENVKEMEGKIIEELKERKLLKKEEKIVHSYPFCWRCDTPLLYYALLTWYVKVKDLREDLLKNNEKIYWRPEHMKEGRFGKWLEGARDWAFSRNRFWGAPIPIWECDSCGAYKCIGSKAELTEELEDLHRPFIDKVVFPCSSCKGKMKRVEEVFDCWFESGSMPYGQWHYPFENKEFVEKTFPADFIAEGVDQTRGWFYTLHILATALTKKDIGLGKESSAFSNVVVNGFIFDDKGKKLSKKLGNYPAMDDVFSRYGADSLRFFLLSSTPIGEDYRFSEEKVKETYRRVLTTFYHSFSYFLTYGEKVEEVEIINPLNIWMISRVNETNKKLVEMMEKYDLTSAARELDYLIDDLSNWYIRRAREKFKEGSKEFSSTLFRALVSISQMLAPLAPFLSEHVYKELTGELSVHLSKFPKEGEIDNEILSEMKKVRSIVSEALRQRAQAGIKVRQPLSKLEIDEKIRGDLVYLVCEEVNVKEVVEGKEIKLDLEITPKLQEEGDAREVTRVIQNLRKKGSLTPKDNINLFYGKELENLFQSKGESIARDVLAKNVSLLQEDSSPEVKGEVSVGNVKAIIGISRA